MGVISSKWLEDFYSARPQLKPPPKTVLGYLVGDKIKPAIESLLNIVDPETEKTPIDTEKRFKNRMRDIKGEK